MKNKTACYSATIFFLLYLSFYIYSGFSCSCYEFRIPIIREVCHIFSSTEENIIGASLTHEGKPHTHIYSASLYVKILFFTIIR